MRVAGAARRLLPAIGVIILPTLINACGEPRQLVYRQTPEGSLHLSLFTPKPTSTPRALVVLFHGGGWWTGSREQFNWFGNRLSEAGYLVAVPEYRTHGKHGTGILEAADDARAAISWLEANRREFSAAQAPLILGGGSAGGHLALVATSTLPSPPDLLWLLNPVLDLHNATPESGFSKGELQLIAALSQEQRKALSFLGPGDTEGVLGLRPALVAFGDQDPLWGCYEPWLRRIAKQMGTIKLSLVRDAGHGFFNGEERRDAVLEEALRFFKSNLRDEG